MFRSPIVMVIVFVYSLGTFEVSAENLLVNPGFESGTMSTPFDYRSIKAGAGSMNGWNYTVTQDTFIKPASGINPPSPTNPSAVSNGNAVYVGTVRKGVAKIYQDVPVSPDTTYRASVWVNGHDKNGQGFGHSSKDSAGLILIELDKKGQVVLEHPKVEITKDSNGYVKLSKSFKPAPETAKVRFMLETSVSDTYWHGRVTYDECVLKPISDGIVIAAKGAPAAVIIAASDDALMKSTELWCRKFLSKRGFAVEPEIVSQPATATSPLWVLEVKDDCPVADSMNIKTSFLDTARADAYILNVFRNENRPVVSIVGRNAQGVRAGVARLVSFMFDGGNSLTVAPTSEYKTPFYSGRRLATVPTGRIAQKSPWADTLWTNWPDERIRKYAEQLWLFGFNSIEVSEIRGYRGNLSDEDLKTKITPKIRTLMKAVRDNGMQVSLFIWGQSLFSNAGYCWNNQRGQEWGRDVMEKEYQRLAQTYGDLTDHIVVHVSDPGGCSCGVCDPYETTQEIASSLHNEFKKINPKVTATLSTWANNGFWKGKSGVKFLDESFSSKEIAIALSRWYDTDKAKIVRDAGRQCDIWGWYLSDYEMALRMTLTMYAVDKNYSALPEQASRDIRTMSAGQCFMGWPQDINFYVTAQKMWSPYRSLAQIEREYCAGIFGDNNADAMVAVYQACEGCEPVIHPIRWGRHAASTDSPPNVFGTTRYNQQIRNALKLGKSVKLNENKLPLFTTATDPQAHYDFLMNKLMLLQVFSETEERMALAKDEGKPKEQLQKIFDNAIELADAYQHDPDYKDMIERLQDVLGGSLAVKN